MVGKLAKIIVTSAALLLSDCSTDFDHVISFGKNADQDGSYEPAQPVSASAVVGVTAQQACAGYVASDVIKAKSDGFDDATVRGMAAESERHCLLIAQP